MQCRKQQCTVCLVLLFLKLNLYYEFHYNRRWFYLLILITIIDLALLNLKQMLEVLTAQLLGLGVRSSVTMDEMKTTVRTVTFSTQCKVQLHISSNVKSTIETYQK